MGMEKSLADEILRLKRLLAEQESLNRVLHARLEEREREIERLLAQLDKLRRMYFGSQSEKLARRITQTEAQLKILQQESDAITGRVDDPAVPRPLRQTRTRKPFPQELPAMSTACVQQRQSARTVEERCHTLEKILLSSWS